MTKQILTNEIKLDFTIESMARINKRFVIIRFDDSGDLIKKYDDSPLDKLKYQLDALSVAYLRGKQFYALFDREKHGNESEIVQKAKEILRGIDLEERVAVKFVRAQMNGTVKEIDKRHLAQLLFNALPNLVQEGYGETFRNATGKLFFILNTHWTTKTDKQPEPIIRQYETIELSMDSGRFPLFNLGINVRTFTNAIMWQKTSAAGKKWSDLKFFKIDELTRTMRRVSVVDLKENDKNVFINHQFEGTKASIALLDFKDYSHFEKSKSGVLFTFQWLIERYLKDYVGIEYVKPNFDNLKTLPFEDEQWSGSALHGFYGVRDLVIVDEVKNEVSQNHVMKIQEILEKLKEPKKVTKKAQKPSPILRGCNILVSNELTPINPNIRIVHKKDYYSNSADDPHQNVPSDCLVHHVTAENFEPSKEAIENILKEMVIKNDIKNRKVTMTDWVLEDGWQFILPDAEGGFGRLVMKKGGAFSYDYYGRNEFFDEEILLEIANAVEKKKLKFEAWLVSPNGDINGIVHTNRLVLPDFWHIGQELRAENRSREFSQMEILAFFEAFFTKNQTFRKEEKVKMIFEKLQNAPQGTTKKILQELIIGSLGGGEGNKTGNLFKKAFAAFFKEKFDDTFAAFFREKEQRKALFALNINYDFEETMPFYFVGKADSKGKTLKKAIINASNIREIHVIKGSLVFKPLLKMLNVDFVKHGELTVLPFPFKYVRELMQQKTVGDEVLAEG